MIHPLSLLELAVLTPDVELTVFPVVADFHQLTVAGPTVHQRPHLLRFLDTEFHFRRQLLFATSFAQLVSDRHTCHELTNAVSASVIVRNLRIVHA